MKASFLQALSGSLATVLLGFITWILRRILAELKGFLNEHAYLLALGNWSKTGLFLVASKLELELSPPPVLGRHAKRSSDNGS